jgi:uncharacterized membrane protein YgcG
MEFLLAVILTLIAIGGCVYIFYLANKKKQKDANINFDLPQPTGTEAVTGMYKHGMVGGVASPTYDKFVRPTGPDYRPQFPSNGNIIVEKKVYVERDNSDALLTEVFIGDAIYGRSNYDSPSFDSSSQIQEESSFEGSGGDSNGGGADSSYDSSSSDSSSRDSGSSDSGSSGDF